MFLFLFLFVKVFREVFSTIIDDFKTYKPLLSAIKNEYEIMLTYFQEKVNELEPLRVCEKLSLFFH